MTKCITHVIRAGLLPALLIACQLNAYADGNTGKSIVVSQPDKPDHIVKLRPFMPNRALPSRAQLQALQAQRAQMAAENQVQSRLSGQVSAFDNSGEVNYPSAYADTIIAHHKNHRFNQAPTSSWTAGNSSAIQLRAPYMEKAHTSAGEPAVTDSKQSFSFLRMAEQNLSTTFSHPSDTSAGSQTKSTAAPQFSESVTPSWPPAQFNQSVTNTPLAMSVSPVAMAPSSPEQSGFSAGPPPFPLCLLPSPVLKQLIRSMAYSSGSHSNTGISSSFGSWHNSVTFSPETPPSASSSPLGSFRLYSPVGYNNGNYRPASAPHIVTKVHRPRNRQAAQTNKSKLINYPAYPTYSYQSVP